MPEKPELSVTEQIVNSAPERCRGCDNLFTLGSAIAIKVLESQISLEQAEEEFQADLAGRCRGRIYKHTSWGVVAPNCTYDIPLGQITATSNR